MISIPKAKIDETINRLEIAVGTPTVLPCSNPIMAVHSWAQDVFWKAPEQSRAMIQATIRKQDTLIPRGAGCLHGLRCHGSTSVSHSLSIFTNLEESIPSGCFLLDTALALSIEAGGHTFWLLEEYLLGI